MYRLFIVDDEDWIRERLIKTIDWNKIGIEIVGEAGNGRDALEKVGNMAPDIVITDIRMPYISGLDFISQLRQKGSGIKIIIISGYGDFEYAQKAIEFGVHDYMLKPFENEELLKVIDRCVEDIEKEKKIETVLNDLEKKLAENWPILKERFYFDLINGYINKSTVEQNLKFFNIQNKGLNHLCFLIELDKPIESGKDAYLIQIGIKNITQELSSLLGRCEVLSLQAGEVVAVISSDMQRDKLEKKVQITARKAKSQIFSLFKKTVTIGIGGICDDILKIVGSFLQAHQALFYKSYLGSNSIYTIENECSLLKGTIKHVYSIEKIKNAVNNTNRADVYKILDELLKSLDIEEMRPIDFKVIYLDIVFSIIKSTVEYNNINKDIPAFDFNFLNQINEICNFSDFSLYLKEKIEDLISYLEKSHQGKKRKIVRMAIEFIIEHFNEQITLADVADNVMLNPSYLCKIFKDEMGVSFTNYLRDYRMEKAVKLMEDPTLKIYQIAKKVGYDDVQYFTKIFKAVKSATPNKYRDIVN